MRRLPITYRQSIDAQAVEDVEVLLVQVEHASFDAPQRLTSDPTVRLSDDPLRYGTRSAWLGNDPATEPFQFVYCSAVLPDDLVDAPASAQFVLDLYDASLVAALRGFTNRATAHLAVVLASDPDTPLVEFRNLRLMTGEAAEGLTLTFSRYPVEEEAFPTDRITKDRFPGLFR